MNKRIGANLAAFGTVFLWASAFPLTKIIGAQVSANPLSLIRCFIAALLMIVIGLAARSPELHLRKPFKAVDLLYFLVTGATGFAVYFICFNTGLVTLTSAESSVISATAPVITSIMVFFIYNERIKLIGWIAIFAAFAGVAIMMLWNGVFSIKVGAFWILGMSVVFSVYSVINRKLTAKGYNALEIVAYSAIFGTLMLVWLVPQTVHELANADVAAIWSVVYLGVFPTGISYILWAKAIELADNTSEVTNYMFVTPLLSTVMGFMMLHEVPDLATIVGGLVIIASVVVFNLKGLPEDRL